VDPKQIFELIVKADEKLKYATDANRELREHQAKELLLEALEAAREAGNAALVAQAEQRLTDLGMPPVAGAGPGAFGSPAGPSHAVTNGDRGRGRNPPQAFLQLRKAPVSASS
jgi:hypothetical protein